MTEQGWREEFVTQALITPECRENRGNGGAFDEAIQRLRQHYDEIVEGWADAEEAPNLQLIFVMHRPVAIQAPPVPPLPTEGSDG